ncbi:MAG: aminotransferase class I/II-fold pyridoxal phosphate-dependent enzyme [Silvanigrellales bacterium]|nr:aminotransferase class I/II-fold pyridoxal phosphate-dependent enzyme [Silvanigrellales bacterium]
MESWLEEWRFKARYNLGESGHRARTVEEFLRGAGVSAEEASRRFLATPLCDSPNRGRDDLRDAIAAIHPGATRENVLVTTGTSEALFLLFRTLAPKSVALLLPAFQLLYEVPERMGARIVGLPVRWNESGEPLAPWALWFEILERERPEVVVFNHPHNPSGLVFSESEIRTLQEFCAERSMHLVADEHYRFLSTESVPLGPTCYRHGGSITVTGSFIKCTGTPGLRVGWCVGNEELLKTLQNEKNYTTHTVNPVVEWMALVGLQAVVDPTSWLSLKLRAEWEDNRKVLASFLASSAAWQGAVPKGGLVCALSHSSWNETAAESSAEGGFEESSFAEASKELRAEGIFLLPLETMEFRESYARMGIPPQGPLEMGRGFRLGLGCEPRLFQEALLKIARIARDAV